MPRVDRCLLTLVAAAAVLGAAACGGGSGKSATSTPEAASPTAQASVARATASASATQAPSDTPAAGQAAVSFTADLAKTLIDGASLTPKDLPAGWTVMSDMTQDNIAAATADPAHAASIQRCGRLLGRTVANQPPDTVAAYLGGQTVSFFSTLTVFETSAGAIDCATEATQRYTQPGEFARAFGQLFVDPNAVKIAVVDYPQVGDASFAATLSGLISAAGTQVDLTILIVAFRAGNVTAAVGSAAAAAPTTAELKPYVDLVLQRINAGTQ